MDPEKLAHWQAADAAFDHWLDLPDAQRDAWLATENLPEPVRRRLVQLINAHQQPRASLDPAGNNLAGCRLGDWTLDTELGRGGMAVVYRAWREDGIARQQAAVKILTLGALGATGRERFQREATILARLNHPNVTALIDSGVADDGTCWLAMPLVDGQRIDRWCETHSPDARAIVRLYLQVCEAVAYAHRNLVIHRDIKPSNVLVDDDGHVRLLDFGIGQFADAEGERTQTMWRALTPGYAAPEQLAGAPPGTAVDVYGLGALLHRLLTGRTPQATTESTDTTRPSLLVRSSDDAYHQHYVPLKNDLDRVLLKCLAEEPERRYATAEALADDLRRWLDGQPVLAQKPKPGYRMRKFVMRNKVGVAAGVLLVASLAGGVAATLWQAGKAREQAALAGQQAELARQEAGNAREQAQRATLVRDFLQHVFVSTNPDTRDVPTALDLLEEGARRARSEIATTDPLAAADILQLTGVSRLRLNRIDEARDDLELALKLLAGASAGSVEHAREAASIHEELARVHRVRGDTAEAIRHARGVVAASAHPDFPLEDRLRASNALGMALATTAPDEAEALHRQVLAEVISNGLQDSRLHLDTLNGITTASGIGQSGTMEEKLSLTRERLRIVRGLFGEDSGPYAYTAADAVVTLRKSGSFDEAEALGRQAVEITGRIYDQPHVHAALAHCNLASYLRQRGRFDEAQAHYARSSAIDIALKRMDLHAESCFRGQAYTLAALGRHAAAAEAMARSAAILARHGAGQAKTTLGSCGLAASLKLRSGDMRAAARVLDGCAPADDAEAPLDYLQARAELQALQGDAGQAAPLLARLRGLHPPEAVFRDWQRPWMLSVLLAHDDADARALLVAALGEHAARAPLSHCLARPDRTRCLALP